MNYTKGKWEFDPKPQKYDDKNGYYIQGVDVAISLAYVYPTDDDDETIGNTHLIAAAPDMYEFIKQDYQIPDCGGDFCFLATEGMENECAEPEEGPGHCQYKDQCRAMNQRDILRRKILAKAEAKP